MKIVFNKKRNGILAAIGLVLLAVIVAAMCVFGRGGNQPDVTEPTGNIVEPTEMTDNTEGTAGIDETVDVTEPSVPSTEATSPVETTSPVEAEPSPEPTEPEETKPSDSGKPNDPDAPSEVLVTMYATKKVNYRKGPGTDYEKAGSLSKGEAVQVVKGSKTDDGWYKIVVDKDYYYVSASYLSSTKPVEEKPEETKPSPKPTEPEVTEPSAKPTEPASTGPKPTEPPAKPTEPEETKPSTGSSSNGETIYTYPDGTTGTVPKEGATYVDSRGVTRVWHEAPSSSLTEEEKKDAENGVFHCHHCGRVQGDGSHGTCLRYLMEGDECPCCGKYVPVQTCHTCN